MPKKPFSGKAKKAQLQAKRERKAEGGGSKNLNLLLASKFKDDPATEEQEEVKVSGDSKNSKPSRYRLMFKAETKKEIAESREKAQKPIDKVVDLTSTTEMYFDDYHDFPQRQDWSDAWSKDRLERSEQKYFREYVDQIFNHEDMDEDADGQTRF